MAIRDHWLYNGYKIQSYPSGTIYKYVVYLDNGGLLAAISLAEIQRDIDRTVARYYEGRP